jgi:uncharacterized membrane protein
VEGAVRPRGDGAGYAAEWVGLRSGLPVGDYRYTGLLWPQIGGVLLAVALAWGGMGLAAHAVAGAIAPVNVAATTSSLEPSS